MRVYTYSEARQNLSELLSLAENEEIVIQRRDGKTFTVNFKPNEIKSPFDVRVLVQRLQQKTSWMRWQNQENSNK